MELFNNMSIQFTQKELQDLIKQSCEKEGINDNAKIVVMIQPITTQCVSLVMPNDMPFRPAEEPTLSGR